MMKRKLCRYIGYFLLFMIVFTMLSRVVMQVSTPKVTTVYPQKLNITQNVQVDATVEGSQKVAVITVQGVRIADIKIREGSYVEKGNVLFVYDLAHLKEMRKILGKEMDALIKDEGRVFAEVEGKVVRMDLEIGRESSGSGDIVIADAHKGKHVECIVEKEYHSYLTVGQSVSMKYTGELFGETYFTTGEGEIVSIEEDKDTGMLHVFVDVSDLDVTIGEQVSVTVVDTAVEYYNVVPREALHFNSEGYFVYIVKEDETIMGTEKRIYTQVVDVVDENAYYVALENISDKYPIILYADRMIEEGDRVQIEEQ